MASTHLRNHLLNYSHRLQAQCIELFESTSSLRALSVDRDGIDTTRGLPSDSVADSLQQSCPTASRRLQRVARPDAGARWNRGEAGDAGSAARGWRRMRARPSRRARSHSTFAAAANVAQRIGTLTPGRPAHSKQFAGIGGVALSPADARARESAPKRRRRRAAPRGRARSGGGDGAGA